MRVTRVFLSLAIASSCFGSSAIAGEPESKSVAAAVPEDKSRWCAPELEALDDTTCVADTAPKEGRATLVIFLHGVIAPKTTWQWTQQRAATNATKIVPMTVLMPRGFLGMGSGSMKDVYAWPTGQAAQREYEGGLIESLLAAKKKLETRRGRPYDDVFIAGFSSGAYYASSLALRGTAPFDGYALMAGGTKNALAKDIDARKPIFLSITTKDKTTRDDARELAKALDAGRWPHRTQEEALGHMFTADWIARSVRYFVSLRTPR